MSISDRQIGQASSTENTLLHNILKQLQRLTQVIGSTSGGGGTPGGSNTEVQYNNGGSFAGSPNLVFNGTTLSSTQFSGGGVALTGIPESGVTNLVSDLAAKQATLVSGTNIKTINGSSVLGSGDLTIGGTVASFAETLAGTDNTKTITPLRLRQVNQTVYNVEAYGAVHDGKIVFDGSISSASSTLTSATAAFVLADVGKIIVVSGAGAAGAALRTTISGYTNGTTVTLTNAASTTSNNAEIVFGTDETASIQAAEAAAFAAGGGTVYFPNGIYIINGALQTSVSGVNPNCQIYIESIADGGTNNNFPAITFMGESANPSAVGYIRTGISKGVILFSTIVGSGTAPAIIGTKGQSGNYFDFNLSPFYMENITFQTFTNKGVTSSMGCFNGRYFATLSATNCAATTDVALNDLTDPSGSNSYGFIFSQISNNGPVTLTNVTAGGFDYGFVLGEHVLLDNISAYGNSKGVAFLSTDYGVTGYGLIFNNITNLFFQGATLLGIPNTGGECPINLRMEAEDTGGVNWYNTIYFFQDNANQAKGTVVYLNHLTNAMWTSKTGGTNLFTVPYTRTINNKWSQADNYGVKVETFNTSASDNTAVMENTMNEATSGDSKYPVFQQSVNQTGTGNIAAVWQVSNAAIAAAEKSLYRTFVMTDGATNTAIKYTRLLNAGTGVTTMIETPVSTTLNVPITASNLSGTNTGDQPIYSGNFSQVGAATTVFTVTIGTTQANNTYEVNVTPTAALSAALFYVTNKTTTTFDVTYLAGLTGTVTFDWILKP